MSAPPGSASRGRPPRTSGGATGDPVGPVTLVVIAKEPVPGRVKTRLCPPCTPEQAAEVARACLLDTFATVAAVPVGRRVVALEGSVGDWLPGDVEVVEQGGGGLDERLGRILAGSDAPTLIIGMDTPHLGAARLGAAVRALCRPGVDAVLGPAPDGGYWCIGMARPCRDAVVGVPMSTARTFREQLSRLVGMGLGVQLVDTVRDIDEFPDAVAAAAEAAPANLRTAMERIATARPGAPEATGASLQ